VRDSASPLLKRGSKWLILSKIAAFLENRRRARQASPLAGSALRLGFVAARFAAQRIEIDSP
jgi:hypothetical protein